MGGGRGAKGRGREGGDEGRGAGNGDESTGYSDMVDAKLTPC